jgi:NADPH:quinone reductase-like Zn-dependent oxidoreductase
VKAIVVGEGEGEAGAPLRWTDVPDPDVGPGEVLVEVHATALNRADLMQRDGRYPPPPGASTVLGLEMAGRVRWLGPGVEGWEVGDRVAALLPGGGYAELACVPARLLMPVPERLSLVEAAAVPEVFFTAYSALFLEGRAAAGEVVLVHAGASGVGTAAIQLARRAGLRVLATAGGPEKASACRALGAELAVDRFAEDFEEAVRAHLGDGGGGSHRGDKAGRLHRSAGGGGGHVGPGGTSGPGGVDVIVDMVGRDYFERNLRLLNVLGRLVFVAAQSGADVPLSIYSLTSKRLSLVGATLRARPLAEKIALRDAFMERFGADLAAGRIAPVVDRAFRIAQAEEAHAYMAANRNIGKVVLVVR